MPAYLNTISQPWNGIQAQLGGVNYYLVGHDGYVDVHVGNDVNFYSLAYHLPSYGGISGWDRFGSGFGPMGNVRQDYYWTERVPR